MHRTANPEQSIAAELSARTNGLTSSRRPEQAAHRHVANDPAAETQATQGAASQAIFRRQFPRPVSLEIVSGVMRGIDGAAGLVAALAALVLTMPDLPMVPSYYIAIAIFGSVVMACAMSVAGAYRVEMLRRSGYQIYRVLSGWIATALAVAAAVISSGASLPESSSWLLLWFVMGGSVLLVVRALLGVRLDQWRQAGRLRSRVAIFGSGATARNLLRRLDDGRIDIQDHIVVGLYDNRDHETHVLSGDIYALLDDIRHQRIDVVIIAIAPGEGRPAMAVEMLRQAATDIYVFPDIRDIPLDAGGAETIGGVPLLAVERRPLRNWRGIAKAFEDCIFAAVALALVSPLLLLITILIKLDSPGPVLFRQKRYGLNNQLIEVLKFRTMRQDMCDPTASQLTRRNDPRVTRIGAFLRRTSLDELPQFLNVLYGEMSVVGPRPHATAAKAAGLLYQEAVPNYDCRHRMKPGITGLAQVSGWRGETETVEQIRKRVEHDIYYIENWSLLMDAQIILRTIFGGFTGRQAF